MGEADGLFAVACSEECADLRAGLEVGFAEFEDDRTVELGVVKEPVDALGDIESGEGCGQ